MLYQFKSSFDDDCRDASAEYAKLPYSYYGNNDSYNPSILEEECFGNPDKEYAPPIAKISDHSPVLEWINGYGQGPRTIHQQCYFSGHNAQRNQLYYALAYAAYFKMARRMEEKNYSVPLHISQSEYDRLGALQSLYHRKAVRLLNSVIEQVKSVWQKNIGDQNPWLRKYGNFHLASLEKLLQERLLLHSDYDIARNIEYHISHFYEDMSND